MGTSDVISPCHPRERGAPRLHTPDWVSLKKCDGWIAVYYLRHKVNKFELHAFDFKARYVAEIITLPDD